MSAAIRICTRIALFLIAFLCSPFFVFAEGSAFDMSLEELMSVEVSSVSKKPQQLKDIPAAVYIISAEDIRRSGAANIPEVLRLAPGIQVQAISNNKWSVSIRGAAREYSNKLLILVDGRSVYSPTFSGLMWEALEVPLENILRIEVIRGPGASIWGSNAVNGVINIITKPAAETPGMRLVLAAGDLMHGSAFLSHGYKQSENTSVRVHARGFDYTQSKQENGSNGEDAWNNRSIGFRLDRDKPEQSRKFMLQGNAYVSKADDEATMSSWPPSLENVLFTQRIEGVNLSARWDYTDSKDRRNTLQASFEQSALRHLFMDEYRNTLDLEFTRNFRLRPRHDLVWGVGARLNHDSISSTQYMFIDDRRRNSALYRFFFNDDITLRPDKLKLSISAGIEHNDITGFEFQPSLRLMMTPDSENSLWLAFSNASRTPSRLESGSKLYYRAELSPPFPFLYNTTLNNTDSEKLDAVDLGWRRQIERNLSFSFAAFYFRFKDVLGSNMTSIEFDPAGYAMVNTTLNNLNSAEFRGTEFGLDWNPHEKWLLQFAYSYININTAIPEISTPLDVRKNVPERSFSLFSKADLSPTVQWDSWFRHNGANEFGNLPGYDVVDSRIAWKVRPGFELSVIGQNLFDKRYQQMVPDLLFSKQREFRRQFYVKSEWSF